MRKTLRLAIYSLLLVAFVIASSGVAAAEENTLNMTEEDFVQRFTTEAEYWSGELKAPIVHNLGHYKIVRYDCTEYVTFELKVSKETDQIVGVMMRCHSEVTEVSSGDLSWGSAILPKAVDPSLSADELGILLKNLGLNSWERGRFGETIKNGINYKCFFSSAVGTILSAEPADDSDAEITPTSQPSPVSTNVPSPTAKPTAKPYTTYEKGSKGDGVKALQARLIELKYLTGSADGAFGEKTALAVTAYQKAEGMTPTGIADSTTQERMFSSAARENPDPPFDKTIYDKLNYKAVARDPDLHRGSFITFKGKVIQVIEGDTDTQYRIATKGSYDDVIYVGYTRPSGASRILDDDSVTVYGMCLGVISYESTMGGTITIPACMAERIELN